MTQARFIAMMRPRARSSVEQRQQRQPQDREVVALDALEQLHAEALELVGADRLADAVAGAAQVLVEERVGEVAHGEARRRDVAPCHRAASRPAPPPSAARASCRVSFKRLARAAPASAGFDRISAPSASTWSAPMIERAIVLGAHVLRLGAGEDLGDLQRPGLALLRQLAADRRLVDVGRLDREGDARRRQHLAPRPARRRQHDLVTGPFHSCGALFFRPPLAGRARVGGVHHVKRLRTTPSPTLPSRGREGSSFQSFSSRCHRRRRLVLRRGCAEA